MKKNNYSLFHQISVENRRKIHPKNPPANNPLKTMLHFPANLLPKPAKSVK